MYAMIDVCMYVFMYVTANNRICNAILNTL